MRLLRRRRSVQVFAAILYRYALNFPPVRIGVDMPYRLQEGLLELHPPQSACPGCATDSIGVYLDRLLLQAPPAPPRHPSRSLFEEPVFPRQNTTSSRREHPLTKYNATDR